jgi:hypothetical protein
VGFGHNGPVLISTLKYGDRLMVDADAGWFGVLVAILKWVPTLLIAPFVWLFNNQRSISATLHKHEIDAAGKFGKIESIVERFDSTATRIHERIDEMNNYLRGKK